MKKLLVVALLTGVLVAGCGKGSTRISEQSTVQSEVVETSSMIVSEVQSVEDDYAPSEEEVCELADRIMVGENTARDLLIEKHNLEIEASTASVEDLEFKIPDNKIQKSMKLTGKDYYDTVRSLANKDGYLDELWYRIWLNDMNFMSPDERWYYSESYKESYAPKEEVVKRVDKYSDYKDLTIDTFVCNPDNSRVGNILIIDYEFPVGWRVKRSDKNYWSSTLFVASPNDTQFMVRVVCSVTVQEKSATYLASQMLKIPSADVIGNGHWNDGYGFDRNIPIDELMGMKYDSPGLIIQNGLKYESYQAPYRVFYKKLDSETYVFIACYHDMDLSDISSDYIPTSTEAIHADARNDVPEVYEYLHEYDRVATDTVNIIYDDFEVFLGSISGFYVR